MRTWILALLAAGIAQLICTPLTHAEDKRSGVAYIRSGSETMPGFFYKPEGKGPFPAVIMVRAVSRAVNDANEPEVAKTFVNHGYAVIFPTWHIPADVSIANGHDPANKKSGRSTLPEFQAMAQDIAAAVAWAKTQSFIDENKIGVVGHATGGILAMLLLEQEIGVRGYVVFSPAAALWNERVDLQKAFVNSIHEAKAPIFLIQAQNDLTLSPSELLGKELSRKGDASYCKVYPPFGTTREQGNNFAVAGSSVWGDDVFKFLERAMN